LLRALGTKNDARYNLKIIDTGEPGDRPAPRRDDKPAPADDGDDVTPATTDEPMDEEVVEEEKVEEVVAEDEPSDVVSRTRAELADLDDLDV
jgi:hypothetical protein